MKKTFFVLIFFFFTISVFSQVKMPQPSSSQTIWQDFGMGSIELTYSRPNAKGRKIFGDLVPYNKLWRTGANAATKIVITDALEMGGKKIDSGTYVLYTIPNVDGWTVILNKGIKNWGSDGYKESDDVIRFKVDPLKMKSKLETLTMQFENIKPESCELHIKWAKIEIAIPITTNIKDRLRSQIETALQTDKKSNWQAAQFYKEYDNNLPKALENCSKAIEGNEKAYYIWLYKAKIQKEMGDKNGAKKSAQKSLVFAKEAKNDDYVKMDEALLKTLK